MFEIIHGFLKNMGRIGRALLFIAGGCLIGAVLVGGEGRMAFVTTGIALSIAGLVFYLIGRQLGGLAGLTKHMRASGLPGTATVVGVSDTGVTVNNDPVAALTLDVFLFRAVCRNHIIWGFQHVAGFRRRSDSRGEADLNLDRSHLRRQRLFSSSRS